MFAFITQKRDDIGEERQWSQQFQISDTHQECQWDQQYDHVNFNTHFSAKRIRNFFNILRYEHYVNTTDSSLINYQKTIHERSEENVIEREMSDLWSC